MEAARLSSEALSNDGEWLPARMPAQVHDILLGHGRIPDPHLGRNAAECTWIAERDWAYTVAFPPPDRTDGPVFLRFDGLDTLVDVHLNGKLLAQFDDMFRRYAIDVQDHLAPAGQENRLSLLFRSPVVFLNAVAQPPEHEKVIGKHKYLRKAANDFNSYLGARPNFIKVGIYRDVVLDVPDRAWVEDVEVRARLSEDRRQGRIEVAVEARGAPATIAWTLMGPDAREAASGTSYAAAFTVYVETPSLWRPWTHGQPNLYRLEVRLLADGEVLDSAERTLGFRDIQPILEDPATGEKRFAFEVNGQRIFLRGANWVPVEGMTHCWDEERARRLLDLAQTADMNVLRVWGGGYEPPQSFYEECDRRGILVWQDFYFEYGMHPVGWTERFDDNCRQEVEGMVRRLRHHPCILLWCGGNENYMGYDYDIGGESTIGRDLFERLIPEACARLDPDLLYHPSSPYGGPAANDPLEGDWHDYTWRHLSPDTSVPLFCSEGGRASATSVKSMRRFLSDEEIWPEGWDPRLREAGRPLWPPMWRYRSVEGSWIKVAPLEDYGDPSSAEELSDLIGVAHGEYVRETVERYRRGVPDGSPDGDRRCWGYMVWRLNDAWPIHYYSVLDYYREPKIAYYYLRRAFAPVLVCFEPAPDALAVWIVNDSPETVGGALTIERLRFDGTVKARRAVDVSLAPGEAKRCMDTAELGYLMLQSELLCARFGGRQATYLPTKDRRLHLPKATLSARPVTGGVELSTDAFARRVALDMDGVTGAVFEDSFFDLLPGEPRMIRVLESASGSEITAHAYNAAPVRARL